MGKAGKFRESTASMLPVLLACSFTASFGQSMMNVALPELAERFLKFMLSEEFQSLIPTGNWMYPVTRVALPKGFNQNETPAKSLHLDEAQIAAQRKAWLQEWRGAVSQ